MLTAIIPDTHERPIALASCLLEAQRRNCEQYVFLGDWFDSFDASDSDFYVTIGFLKEWASHDDVVLLWGNHDIHYAFPKAYNLRCSGYSASKQLVIDGSMPRSTWSKFQLWTKVGRFWVSHAGFSYYNHHLPYRFSTVQDQKKLFESAIWDAAYADILQAGGARGGRYPLGGITWLDWRHEFQPISGINQIVGHTQHAEPQCLISGTSENWCIDTGLRHMAITDGQEVEIVEV